MGSHHLEASISETLKALILTKDPAEIKAMLEQLALALRQAPPDEVARAIRAFFDSRNDASTHLSFRIEKGGNLSEAPTLRTWLLDQLGRLNSSAAAEMARSILATPESADEWAVAMRNFGRAQTSPEDVRYLQEKLGELLRNPSWQQEQSAGWLEAFDVAVSTRATQLTPEFAHMITRLETKDHPAAYASFLTLDRLVLADPVTMLAQLEANPELLAGRELTRAGYFARADVRDPQQRAVLEQYLLDERREPAELEKFAGLYPSANFMLSNNLLSTEQTPRQSQLAEQDRAALAVVEEWLADRRFVRLAPHLKITKSRLQSFLKQAGDR